ncbi:hypothetical protein [Streptomyces sp. CB01881]|uniref:hypothetical protein n=1 Tax=Streptomyces sp. CB01881 TaxID=2078691 RepID=UPI00129C9BA3|nr:hypothetical protein [Streptomyces sp. CB01881]
MPGRIADPVTAEDGSVRGLLTAVAAPRSVYVDGYLDDLRRYLESTAPMGAHR